MKKFKVGLLLCAILLSNGCVVRSVNPFYLDRTEIMLEELQGNWKVVEVLGKKETGEKHGRWIFEDTTLTTVCDGVKGNFDLTFFKIEDTIFVDTYPSSDQDININAWIGMHLYTFHCVWKVEIKDDTVRLIALNKEWFENKAENKEIKIPTVFVSDAEDMLFNASPEQWTKALKKYKDDKDAFMINKRKKIKKVKEK